jgi:CysZ protein
MIPAAVVAVALLGVLGTVLFFIRDESAVLTWFATDWTPWLRTTVQVLAGIALVGVVALVSVLAFTALTLAIGGPFYDWVSGNVDDAHGVPPRAGEPPWWREWPRSVAESLRLLALVVPVGIVLFLGEFVPVVGPVVVPVLGALVGGWVLSLELTGTPAARRGLDLTGRRRMLRARRPAALGFGVCVFVTFLIPLGAVVFMTPAVIGATRLVQQLADGPMAPPAPERPEETGPGASRSE